MEKEFDRRTHCVKCRRYIDEEIVKLKKLVVGPNTYRHPDPFNDPHIRFEKLCTDCWYGK